MTNYLIIGGSSGIGQEIVRELSRSDENQVYASYFSREHSEDLPGVHYFYHDVRDELSESLPDTLDGVVYAPGAIDLKPFHRLHTEQFRSDYELQVVGAIRILQKALPALKKSTKASVVLFSTVAVQTGLPFHSMVSASKGAIEGLVRSLAAEWAPTIRVNAIAPSLTDTPLAEKLLSSEEKKEANGQRHPMKRVGTAIEMAQMATFLLSEKSSWVTGQILAVDGGFGRIKA